MPVRPDLEHREAVANATDNFTRARARAINTYAELEQSMRELFTVLLGADSVRAALVFASMQNARSRLIVLQDLLHIAKGKTHDKFFIKATREMQKIDSARNQIIHWIAQYSVRGGKPFDPERDVFLAEHPNLYGLRKVYINDLVEFVEKTQFYAHLIYYFGIYLKAPAMAADQMPGKTSWHDIFLRPPVYPPPAAHPLNRNPKAHEPPPQSSQG